MSAFSGVSKLIPFKPYFSEGAVVSEDQFQAFVKLLKQTPELSVEEKSEIFRRVSAGCHRCDPLVREKVRGIALLCGLEVDKRGDFISKEISKKNSACWDCIGRHSSGSGSYLYNFQFERYSYTGIAVEPVVPRYASYSITDAHPRDLEARLRKNSHFRRFVSPAAMRDLGYELRYQNGKVKLTLPDRETLQERWSMLKSVETHLPNLHIISSDGVATDKNFIRGFYHDLSGPNLILSEGQEFMHDHAAHITVVINNLLADPVTSRKYQEQFTEAQKFVQKIHAKIEEMQEEIKKGNAPKQMELGLREIIFDEELLAACETVLSAACDLYTNQFYLDEEDPFQTMSALIFGEVLNVNGEASWPQHFGWTTFATGDYALGMTALEKIIENSF